MNDGEVRSAVVRVLEEASAPLKALDIARKIGNGCDRKAVNRALHGPLKDSGAVELATPPGQNPPLWRIRRTGSSQPAAAVPNPSSLTSGGVAPTPAPPSASPSASSGPSPNPRGGVTPTPTSASPGPTPRVGVAPTSSSTSPGPLPESETLYKKREEVDGSIKFTPVSGEHPPTGGRTSSGGRAQIATPNQASSNENLDYTPNAISAQGASPFTGGQKHEVNRFTSSARKDYQKDVPKKQDSVLSRKLNNSEQPPANVTQAQSPDDVEKQLMRTINNSQPSHAQVTEPPLTQSAEPDSTPSSKSKKKKKSKLAAKFNNSSQSPPSSVEALSSGMQSLDTHETPTTFSSTSLRKRILHVLTSKGEVKEEEIRRLVTGDEVEVSTCLAGLLQEGKVEKREDRTGVYWKVTAL